MPAPPKPPQPPQPPPKPRPTSVLEPWPSSIACCSLVRTLVMVSTTSAVLEEILMLETKRADAAADEAAQDAADIGAAGIAVLGNDVRHQDVIGRADLAHADIGAALQRRRRWPARVPAAPSSKPAPRSTRVKQPDFITKTLSSASGDSRPRPSHQRFWVRGSPACRSCGSSWESRPAFGRSFRRWKPRNWLREANMQKRTPPRWRRISRSA